MLGAVTATTGTGAGGAIVEQAVDRAWTARLVKERLTVAASGGPLSVVRKRAEGGPSRGVVVLVHGYAQNRYSWHVSQRSLANALAVAGFDVFNAELRGVGQSRVLGARAAVSVAEYVEEDLPAVAAAALALTGEKRLFLVGHSLGALVALAYAGRAAERVRGVVALAGIYDFARANGLLRLVGRAAAALPAGGASTGWRVPTDVVGRALHRARGAFDAPWAARLPLQAWAPGSMAPDVLAEAVRRSFEPASFGVTRDLGRLSRRQPLLDATGAPLLGPFEACDDVPLLAIAGREDALVSPIDSRAAVDRCRARDRTFLLPARAPGEPGWGHMDLLLGERAPTRVWPRVLEWLAAR